MWLTVLEASQILGTNLSKIYNYIRKAELASTKFYGKIVVSREDVYKIKSKDDELRILWETVRRHAHRKKVSTQAVYQMIWKGKIDAIKKNGITYVRKEAR